MAKDPSMSGRNSNTSSRRKWWIIIPLCTVALVAGLITPSLLNASDGSAAPIIIVAVVFVVCWIVAIPIAVIRKKLGKPMWRWDDSPK
jgi:ABC-type uncharacterized transport system YnjBCD permease subunit